MDGVFMLPLRIFFHLDQAGWVGQGLQWGVGAP